jgi:hypothetical protein
VGARAPGEVMRGLPYSSHQAHRCNDKREAEGLYGCISVRETDDDGRRSGSGGCCSSPLRPYSSLPIAAFPCSWRWAAKRPRSSVDGAGAVAAAREQVHEH